MAEVVAEDISTWDIVAVVLYFVVCLAVGIWSTFRPRDSTENYFLAGKSMTWIPIGASLFATNIGTNTFVSIAGQAARGGIAGVIMLVVLGWVFIPVYFASGTELYVGGLFANQLLGLDLFLSSVILLAITCIYTVVGGLAAVMYTDTIQMFIFAISCTSLFIVVMVKLDGFDGLYYEFMHAVSNNTVVNNLTCGQPPKDALHLMRGMDSEFPWTGFVFGLSVMAAYFFLTNQVMVQRSLAAKSLSHAKAGALFAGYLKLLPFILIIVPGMASRALYPERIACSNNVTCEEYCENKAGCWDTAYMHLVKKELPPGLKGLMVAAMLAALMSSLTSMFNSISTLFTVDLYPLIKRSCSKKKPSEKELLIVGKLFTGLVVLTSLAWVPILDKLKGAQLWDYIQEIASCVTPGFFTVFLMGVFWTRATSAGAYCALISGLVVGGVRFVLNKIVYSAPLCGSNEPDERPAFLKDINYLDYAAITFAFCVVVDIGVSLFTKPRSKEELGGCTWWTRNEKPWVDPNEIKEEQLDIDGIKEQKRREKKRKKAAKKADIWTKMARALYGWVCGFSSDQDENLGQSDKVAVMDSLAEDPFIKRVLDVNAVIAICVMLFLWGYFA